MRKKKLPSLSNPKSFQGESIAYDDQPVAGPSRIPMSVPPPSVYPEEDDVATRPSTLESDVMTPKSSEFTSPCS